MCKTDIGAGISMFIIIIIISHNVTRQADCVAVTVPVGPREGFHERVSTAWWCRAKFEGYTLLNRGFCHTYSSDNKMRKRKKR
jgi:hypothetical protein